MTLDQDDNAGNNEEEETSMREKVSLFEYLIDSDMNSMNSLVPQTLFWSVITPVSLFNFSMESRLIERSQLNVEIE